MSIQQKIAQIRGTLPPNVELVCVSKFHPVEAIEEAYQAGERLFGENRPQEMAAKAALLPTDVKWHFIGNLQTNKVKIVVPYAALIQSVSSEKLFDCIEKEAAKIDKVQDVLLELHVAAEETKQGFAPEEALALITADFLSTHPHIRLCGIMGMASNTDDMARVKSDFERIASLFTQMKNGVMAGKDYFCKLSMGMSGDYLLAIEAGANIVRIGSTIFGERRN